MVRHEILDELHATRAKLLQQAGGDRHRYFWGSDRTGEGIWASNRKARSHAQTAAKEDRLIAWADGNGFCCD
jgi:hypothetical protein